MLDHIDDIESDMSAIHRIGPADLWADDYPLDARTFFKLARRLFAYKGVMRLRAEKEAHDRNPQGTAQSAQKVPMSDPSVAQYFEVD